MTKTVIAGLMLIAATGGTHAQDLSAGEQSFKKCLPCHAVGEDARN
jgi:cytochrome c